MNECGLIIDPQTVNTAIFIAGLTSILILFTLVLQVVKFFRPDPPNHRQYASKEEVDKLDRKLIATETKLEAEIAHLGQKITEQYEKIERSDESRTSGLHNRMNTIAENVARLTGQLETNGKLIETLMKREPK